MSLIESLTTKLDNLSIKCDVKQHSTVTSLESWIGEIKELNPNSKATKTLVLKLKGSSDLLMILSLESTKYSLGGLSKALGHKDARVAGDDVVMDQFGIGKVDVTPFQIGNMTGGGKVLLVIGTDVVNCGQDLAFRAYSATSSMFVNYQGIKQYLNSIGFEFKEVDLENPGEAPQKVVETVAEKGEKEVLMGITVAKEENFSKWYEQVLVCLISNA